MSPIIFLCDRTGVAARPWAEAGHECWCVDVQHSIHAERTERVGAGVIHFVWGDVRSWCPPARPAFLMAFPPCTDVAVSGARDFKAKGLRKLCDALDLFNACQQAAAWSGAPYAIENPVGVLSSHVRKPDHIFQPWQYGENYTKATCLWTGNGFVMPPPTVTEKPANVEQTIWRMPPSPERADLRAVTPAGCGKGGSVSTARTNCIRITLPYPPSLNRMYRAVNGRSILSREGRAYKERTASLLIGATPILDGPVRVTLGVYRPAKRGDLDNTLKATLDALAGVAYRNDKQIVHIDAERFEDKANPRVEVLVELSPHRAPTGEREAGL